MKPIITSFLDIDFYKISMTQCVLHKFPEAQVEFEFKCRNNIDLLPYADEIEKQIHFLADLKFTNEELAYLSTLRYIKKDFIEFLRILRLDPCSVFIDTTSGKLEITIRGSWLYTIWFETMILSIISEVYNFHCNPQTEANEKLGLERLGENLCKIKNFNAGTDKTFRLIEFGTRRRFSKHYHELVISLLKEQMPSNLLGTSNVKFAMDYNLKPIGTHAHEFFQACQGMKCRLADSQKMALETWVQEYRGDLGIALTDTIGIDAFLRDFDLYFAKLYDGCRHDSGCAHEFTRKIIDHYKKLGINPKDKIIVYSDSLDVKTAIDLCYKYEGQIKTSYGIGTKLTNDIPDVTPLNMVIKMTRCNGQPVAKLSDSPGKSMCKDEQYLQYLKKVFRK